MSPTTCLSCRHARSLAACAEPASAIRAIGTGDHVAKRATRQSRRATRPPSCTTCWAAACWWCSPTPRPRDYVRLRPGGGRPDPALPHRGHRRGGHWLRQITEGGGHETRFLYDASGQRVVKFGRGSPSVTIGQFFPVQGGHHATEHVFAGTRRLAPKPTPVAD